MRSVPIPGALNNRVNRCVFRFPAKSMAQFGCVCIEGWRVASATWVFDDWYCMPRRVAGGFNDFVYARPTARSNVEKLERSEFNVFDSKKMRFRKVFDVNVVSHASSVCGGVIRPENADMRSLSERNLQHKRNQVVFR